MSANIVTRRVVATPERLATEAWQVISDLIAPADTSARRELDQVAGIAMSLIALEAPRNSPIVVHGVGPRFRIYCLYDDEAILGEGQSEDVLSWSPVKGDWAMSLPCPADDLAWIQPELAKLSTRITARDATDPGPEERSSQPDSNSSLGEANREAFLRS